MSHAARAEHALQFPVADALPGAIDIVGCFTGFDDRRGARIVECTVCHELQSIRALVGTIKSSNRRYTGRCVPSTRASSAARETRADRASPRKAHTLHG